MDALSRIWEFAALRLRLALYSRQILFAMSISKNIILFNTKGGDAMVEVIAGQKGKGKTKYLLDKANNAIKDAKGSIVYLDKSSKHMYELNTRVRLINVAEYTVKSYEAFIGFICGIISQDHDLEQMYLDSFLKISCLEGQDISEAIDALDQIGKQYGVTFILSISQDAEHLPENARKRIVVSL